MTKSDAKSAPTNVGASVRTRLLNKAKQSNRNYNALLVQYAQERLLYRLSQSRYKSNFVLKGALLLLSYRLSLTRPTKDIDFLGQAISSDLDKLGRILREIASIRERDGIEFLPDSISVENIVETGEYPGVRAQIECNLGGARFPIQLDIGFGDKIVAGPIEIDYQ